jgi:RHS repeat-associated protein
LPTDASASSSVSLTAQYVRGASGDQDTELDGQGNWVHTNLFSGGGLTATYWLPGSACAGGLQGGLPGGLGNSTCVTWSSALAFQYADWLGTRRLETNSLGQMDNAWTSDPYGAYLTPVSFADATEQHFTGKERDTESGNDYFPMRYYASSMGRWISPDPGWILAVHKGDPQTWNMYSYVANNPLGFVDPYGLMSCSQQMNLQHNGAGTASIWCRIGSFLGGLFGGGSSSAGNGSGGGSGGGGGSIPDAGNYGLKVNYDTGINSSGYREIQYQLYNKTNGQAVTHKTHPNSDLFIYETQTQQFLGLNQVGDFFANTCCTNEAFTFTDNVGATCYIFCSTISTTQRFFLQKSDSGYGSSTSYPLTIDAGGNSYNSLDIRIKPLSVIWPSLFSPGAGVQIQNMNRWPGVPAKDPNP